MTEEEQNIERKRVWKVVDDEFKKGNICFISIDGVVSTDFKTFLAQPVEGILYDLNRLEEVIGTFINDPKWVNDYAMAKTVRALHAENRELKARLNQEGE